MRVVELHVNKYTLYYVPQLETLSYKLYQNSSSDDCIYDLYVCTG